MNKKLIREKIDDLYHDLMYNAIIDSEGYPHQPYVSELGVKEDNFIKALDEINELVEISIKLEYILKKEFK